MKPGTPLRFWHRTSRRPSFWLGMFVACFLAWAWWDSTRFETMWTLEGDVGARGMLRFAGSTVVFDEAPEDIFGIGFMRTAGNSPPEEVEAEWTSWEVRYVRIPDSLVFFSFVGLWGGWLVWRARSAQRLAK